jgi:hypothetical protein
MTVLHGASLFVGVVLSAMGFTVAPLAAAGFGFGAQTPSMVITAAVAGTDAAAESASPEGCGLMPIAGAAWPGCAGGGAACPQASVPNRTHNSQILRINQFLQDWSTRKVKNAKQKS